MQRSPSRFHIVSISSSVCLPRITPITMPPEPRSEALPTDPLDALGPSLFLSILSHLPYQSLLSAERVSPLWRRAIYLHEKGVWRSACHRTGVEPRHMRTLES